MPTATFHIFVHFRQGGFKPLPITVAPMAGSIRGRSHALGGGRRLQNSAHGADGGLIDCCYC